MYHVQTYCHSPTSVCSAGDMHQPDDQPKDYESAMGGMTLDSASLTGTEEQDIEDMEKNPNIKAEEGRADKESAAMNYQNEISKHKLC